MRVFIGKVFAHFIMFRFCYFRIYTQFLDFKIVNFISFSHRAQFEQLCASFLARVEPPLKAVMEQASKWKLLD